MKLSFKVLLFFLVFIFVVGFYFFGFTYDLLCPKCNGTGQVWEKRYDLDIETWVTGYWTCSNCRGSGKVYLYSSVSYALAFFFGFVFCFLSFFGLDYGVTALRLNWNPWVKDVKEMRFWFNPMYFVWLFHVNRKKWAKWTTALSLIATFIMVPAIALPLASLSTPTYIYTGQNIFTGWLIGMVLTIPFAIAWYQNYDHINRFLGVQETSKGFFKKCVECGREIPIASEECPYCGTKQT